MRIKKVTYSEARQQLAELLDMVVDEKKVVIVKRGDKPDAAFISLRELQRLKKLINTSIATARENAK